jgi:hypothetical protein
MGRSWQVQTVTVWPRPVVAEREEGTADEPNQEQLRSATQREVREDEESQTGQEE